MFTLGLCDPAVLHAAPLNSICSVLQGVSDLLLGSNPSTTSESSHMEKLPGHVVTVLLATTIIWYLNSTEPLTLSQYLHPISIGLTLAAVAYLVMSYESITISDVPLDSRTAIAALEASLPPGARECDTNISRRSSDHSHGRPALDSRSASETTTLVATPPPRKSSAISRSSERRRDSSTFDAQEKKLFRGLVTRCSSSPTTPEVPHVSGETYFRLSAVGIPRPHSVCPSTLARSVRRSSTVKTLPSEHYEQLSTESPTTKKSSRLRNLLNFRKKHNGRRSSY